MVKSVYRSISVALLAGFLLACQPPTSPIFWAACIDASSMPASDFLHARIIEFADSKSMKMTDHSSAARQVTGNREQIDIHLQSRDSIPQQIRFMLFDRVAASTVVVYGWHDWEHGVVEWMTKQGLSWELPRDGVCGRIPVNGENVIGRSVESGTSLRAGLTSGGGS